MNFQQENKRPSKKILPNGRVMSRVSSFDMVSSGPSHKLASTVGKTAAPPSRLVTRTSVNAGAAATKAAKVIEVKLNLPSLRLKVPKKIIISVASACILIAAFFLLQQKDSTGSSAAAAATSNSSAKQTLVKGTPDYDTVLPAGKTISDLGGWTRISPSGRDPVYTYADKIGHTKISVSEQPLPANFETNTAGQIAELAEGFNADQKLTLSGTTVYIGTSAEGPQSVIFSKNKLLILIKSAAKISNDHWAAYINNLQ